MNIHITELDVLASIGLHEDFPGRPKNLVQLHAQRTSLWRRCVMVTATSSPMWDNSSLESPHQSDLAMRKGAFLLSGTSKVTCVRPWDRTGWLARQWLCIPAMHSSWTPRPYREELHPGKPQEALLPVNHVWLTGIPPSSQTNLLPACLLSLASGLKC